MNVLTMPRTMQAWEWLVVCVVGNLAYCAGKAFWYIPAIGGGCDPVKPDGNKVRTITNLRLTGISLSMKPNSDPRIKPLGTRVESR